MLMLWYFVIKILLSNILCGPQAKSNRIALKISASKTAEFFIHNSFGSPNFGIRPSHSWPSILSNISYWNHNTEHSIYRLVIVGRHGQGVHNIAEQKYGARDWDNKWSKQNGDGILTWGPDANLTEFGEHQARLVRQLWSSQMDLPRPVMKYSSPLSRALRTASITFDKDIVESPLYVLENLRETIGKHTCDRRSRLSQTLSRFPNTVFEPRTTEDDSLWKPDSRENDKQTQYRAMTVLQKIMLSECQLLEGKPMSNLDHTVNIDRVISITTHSGFIRGLFTELDLPPVRVETGGVVSLILHTTCIGHTSV